MHRLSRQFVILAALLSACGAQPSPTMFGAQRHQTHRDGHDYVVFQKDRQVEVIRLGYAPRGQHQAIRTTMIALMGEMTGCIPVAASLRGDSGEMRARVTCP